ncbi:MAG: hypothetical protein ACOH17_07805 [Cellulomonas sp.]
MSLTSAAIARHRDPSRGRVLERRWQTRRAVRAVIVVLAFMAPAAVSQASAAQLALTGAQRPHSAAYQRCDDAVGVTTPSTSGTSASVQVSGIAAACTGTLSVLVYDSTGATRATGSATLTGGGSQTLNMSSAYAPNATDKVSVTIATWPIPATWTYTPLTPYIWCTLVSTGSTGSTCTATVTLFHGTKPGGTSVADYYDVVVTTTSTKMVEWAVTFDLKNAFYGGVPGQLGNSILDPFWDGQTSWDGNDTASGNPANDVTKQGTCSAGLLTVRGTAAGPRKNDFSDVKSTRMRQFSLVANQGSAGYSDVLNGGCA